MIKLGPDERNAIFVPWWRSVVTFVVTVIPIAVIPILARSNEQTVGWLGPLSVVPLVYWLSRRIRRAGEQRERDSDRAAN